MATLTVNATLGNDAVSNAQLENMAEGTLKGRAAGGGTGDPEDLTPDQASTILDAATDPFVRTSDQLETSTGGNGAADAGKVAEFNTEGQLRCSVEGSSIAALVAQSSGTGYAVFASAGSSGAAVRVQHGGSGAAIEVTGATGYGADIITSGSVPLSVQRSGALSTGRIAEFAAGIPRTVEMYVEYDGGLAWRALGTGAQTTRNNLLPSKTGNAGKLLAVNGGETDYELVAPGITDGSALSIGLQFPNAGLTIADQNADHTLVIVPDENLTADRQLSILVDDDHKFLRLTGSLTAAADAEVSGTNTGDQTIQLTGDVTGSGTGSFAATIANDAVTYAKIQNVSATDRILGRQSSGAGDVEEITCTAAGRALLDDADANAQRETLGLIRRKITTATTGVSTSYVDVTDLSFSVVAGTTYSFLATVLAECSSTSGGVCLTANGPAATWFAARYEGSQSAGSIIRSDITAYDSLGTFGEPNTITAANTPYVFTLQGVIVPSANGTFTLRVKRGGTAGNVAVRAGVLEATAM